VKTEIVSAENKRQQIQFNEKMGKYRKSKLKNIVKYNLLGTNTGYANYPLRTVFFWKYLTLIIKSKW
jgi:hypothetical protein